MPHAKLFVHHRAVRGTPHEIIEKLQHAKADLDRAFDLFFIAHGGGVEPEIALREASLNRINEEFNELMAAAQFMLSLYN